MAEKWLVKMRQSSTVSQGIFITPKRGEREPKKTNGTGEWERLKCVKVSEGHGGGVRGGRVYKVNFLAVRQSEPLNWRHYARVLSIVLILTNTAAFA